jgi:site-specific DNA recombinase
MLRNPVYRGEHIYKSRFGSISRDVPALVSQELWERVQDQIIKNRSLPKWNATRVYLLRGMVRCGSCRNSFIGESNPKPSTRNPQYVMHYYRCCRRRQRDMPETGCPSIRVPAQELEDFVWRACREKILNPGAALEEARRRMLMKRGEVVDTSRTAATLEQTLAGKRLERERAITMSRRGLITLDELEQQLGDIDSEATALEAELRALQAQRDLHDGIEAHLANMAALLGQLQTELLAVEQDASRKRQVLEHMIREVRVDTVQVGPGKRGKRYLLTIRHIFDE